MNRIIKLKLASKRKKMLLLNDLIPAGILLLTALDSLANGSINPVTVVNIVSGGLLVSAGLREWRSLNHDVPKRIQWYDLVSGFAMLLNTIVMYKPWKGFQPAYLYFVASILYVLKGFSIIGPVGLFRRLTISDTGFALRIRPFATYQFEWAEISNLEIKDRSLLVTTPSGVRQISLKNIADTSEMSEALISSWKAGVAAPSTS